MIYIVGLGAGDVNQIPYGVVTYLKQAQHL